MNDSSAQESRIASIILTLGDAYLSRGQYADAIEKYKQLIKAGINSPEVYRKLAVAYLGLKEMTNTSRAVYKKALELFPQDEELYVKICKLLLQNKSLDEFAIRCYQKALTFHPPFEEEIYYAFYQHFNERGQADHAYEALKQVVRLEQGRHYLRLDHFVRLSWEMERRADLHGLFDFLLRCNPSNRMMLRLKALDLSFDFLANGVESDQAAGLLGELQAAIERFGEIVRLADVRDFSVLHLAWRKLAPTVNSLDSAAPDESQSAEADALPGPPAGDVDAPADTTGGTQGMSHAGDETILNKLVNGPRFGGTYVTLLEELQRSQLLILKIDNVHDIQFQAGKKVAEALADRFLKFSSDYLHNATAAKSHLLADGMVTIGESCAKLARATIDLFHKLEKYNATAAASNRIRLNAVIHASTRGNDEEHPDDRLTTMFEALHLIDAQHARAAQKKLRQSRLIFDSRVYKSEIGMQTVPARPVGEARSHVPGLTATLHEAVWRNPLEYVSDKNPYRLDRFIVIQKLRSSRSSGTYLAKDRQLDRRAVLKLLSPRVSLLFQQSQSAKDKLLAAARQIGRLDHQGTAMVYDMGFHAGLFYFVREYIEGKSLQEILKTQRQWTPHECAVLGVKLCKILAGAHRRKLVHGNLKPANIWMLASGEIKTADFLMPGFMPRLQEGNPLTGAEWHYTAPERFAGEPPDPRSDVYSVGILLHELLAGQHPFREIPHLSEEAQLAGLQLPVLSSLRPELPEDLVGIIACATSQLATERFSTIFELEIALQNIVRTMTTGHRASLTAGRIGDKSRLIEAKNR